MTMVATSEAVSQLVLRHAPQLPREHRKPDVVVRREHTWIDRNEPRHQ
jgi:hypothetical protein